MLPSQYFDIFVSKNDTLTEIKFSPPRYHTIYFFFFAFFAYKHQESALTLACTAEHAHERAQHRQFFIQFFRRIPIIAVQYHPSLRIETHMGCATNALFARYQAFHAEAKLPRQERLLSLPQAFQHDKPWRIDLHKHVLEDGQDGDMPHHLVERVLEMGVWRIHGARWARPSRLRCS